MKTRHVVEPRGIDAEAVVDVDLSILAAPEARYDAYERRLRLEYAWVDDTVFRARRRALVGRFLDRRCIYWTGLIRERYEHRARANIARALARL